MSGSVQGLLGPTYQPNLWDLRKQVAAARKAGEALVLVRLSAPITSEIIEVAIEAGSLYLIAVPAVTGNWFEFAPDTPGTESGKPRLPGSSWIMAGGLRALSTYRA